MFFNTVLVCLFILLGQVSAELVLEKDVTEKITFDGTELMIEVDNSRGIIGRFTLCIKTSDQVGSLGCPTGYDEIHFTFKPNPEVKTAKMNRQGKVMLGSIEYSDIPSILFNENESLDLILKEVPDQSTKVRLLNAVRYISLEPVEATTLNKSGSMTVFSVVVIVLLAISGLLTIVLIVTICYFRKRTPQKIKHSDGQGQKHITTRTLKADGSFVLLPQKPKLRRTLSKTVTITTLLVKTASSVVVLAVKNVRPKSSLPIAKPIQSSHMSSQSPFDNNSVNNRANG